MKIDKRVLIGTIAAILFVTVIWYMALYHPRLENIASAEATANSLQADHARLEVLRASLESGNQISTFEAQSGLLSTAIPNSPDLPGIINDINDAMETSGIGLTSLTPSIPTAAALSSGSTGGNVQVIHLTLAISGRYFQIVSFLDQVQQLPRIFVVTSIAITGSGNLAAHYPSTLFTPLLTVSISASAFFTQGAGAAGALVPTSTIPVNTSVAPPPTVSPTSTIGSSTGGITTTTLLGATSGNGQPSTTLGSALRAAGIASVPSIRSSNLLPTASRQGRGG
ncbi:MAG TPA: type 4a pilus biogenesis protein PilO [Acidimicrobiales bacterium]|nr:type 4a pilus biogenesis protein PilO [Acidimicrobiales bacterium]